MLENKYLIVLLEDNHRSFCYYESPENSTEFMISEKDLCKAVDFAAAKELPLIFLYGHSKIPEGHRKLIDSVPHSSMASYDSNYSNSSDVTITEESDFEDIKKRGYAGSSNLILRLNRSNLSALPSFIEELPSEISRLNLILSDIQNFKEDDFIAYWNILCSITPGIAAEFNAGRQKEFSFLTDRLVLKDMNNCGAGDKHLTLAPNGKLYICPGFYFKNPEDSVGTLDNFTVPNSQLYLLENAPLCSACDAYHCKRCIFLNRETTMEVNTPGRQQCLGSHVERRASEYLAECLEPGRKIPALPPIDYLEPFEYFTEKNRIFNPQKEMAKLKKALALLPLQADPRKVYRSGISEKQTGEERLEDRERLQQIHQLQKEILVRQDKIIDLLSYIRGI